MTADPLVLVTEVDRATDRLLETVGSLAGDDATLPSLLPGWTRGHVLAHLARNADGLVNLLTWARTGVPTPAYASRAARDADIEAGAARPLGEHLADLRGSADRFADAAAVMPAAGWAALVQTPTGAEVPAATVIWMRLREIEVHHVDLATAYRPEHWPEAFAHRLLHDVVARMADRPGMPAVLLRATDLGHPLTLGPAGTEQPPAGQPEVSGAAYALAAWLTGRRTGETLAVSPDQPLPELPQWI